MLTFHNYSKKYDNHLILEITNLTLSKGNYWIKGENGAGKSTLFKSIVGLIPYEGEIRINNCEQKKTPIEFKKLVCYSEAEPLYPSFLTAKDVFQFVARARQATQEQQTRVIETIGINAFYEKPCGTFSSGMLKKLSLSTAFLGNPTLIILDEPLITLDEEARQNLKTLIEFSEKEGASFLFSSHQSNERLINATSDLKIAGHKLEFL